MKAKILSLLLALAVLLSLAVPALAAENIAPVGGATSQIIGDGNTVVFLDVPSSHWAFAEIAGFSQQGIVNGYDDGTFRPNAGVTREEFCKLLVTTFGQPLVSPETPTFTDVTLSRWSYPYVEVCKDFLTGYANPFGGAPAFHPAEFATREDIAVALVRMMGFHDSDANDPNYARRRFSDGSAISPSLMGYVSLACERGLINGYDDGTFRPNDSISRAEIVVLLNRAMKQAVTNIEDELNATADLVYSQDGRTVTVHITAEEGCSATVNGKAVKLSATYGGEYKGAYPYEFQSEGTQQFTVVIQKAGKTKTIPLTAKYEVGGPVIEITDCPVTSDKSAVTVRGKVEDKNDSYPTVLVNGKDAGARYGYWNATVDLQEGDNLITVVATNKLGRSTTVTRTVKYEVGGPKLTVTDCPVTSEIDTVTVSGMVEDSSDRYPIVTVNGRDARAQYGRWSYRLSLQEGENLVTIVATNQSGRATTVTRTVTYIIDGPKLKITSCPANTTSSIVTLKGTVTDPTRGEPTVTVDGRAATVSYSRYGTESSWTCQVPLRSIGEQTVTIVATNAAGKSTTVTRTITRDYDSPVLKVSSVPAMTDQATLTLSGSAGNPNDNQPLTVTINGETVDATNFSFRKTVTLVPGVNIFEIVATNQYGKSATQTVQVEYVP